MSKNYKKHCPALSWAVFLIFIAVLSSAFWQVLNHPDTPEPTAWNPLQPLNVAGPYSSMTNWKLTQALASSKTCFAALETGAQATRLDDFEESPMCHIRPQVALS